MEMHARLIGLPSHILHLKKHLKDTQGTKQNRNDCQNIENKKTKSNNFDSFLIQNFNENNVKKKLDEDKSIINNGNMDMVDKYVRRGDSDGVFKLDIKGNNTDKIDGNEDEVLKNKNNSTYLDKGITDIENGLKKHVQNHSNKEHFKNKKLDLEEKIKKVEVTLVERISVKEKNQNNDNFQNTLKARYHHSREKNDGIENEIKTKKHQTNHHEENVFKINKTNEQPENIDGEVFFSVHSISTILENSHFGPYECFVQKPTKKKNSLKVHVLNIVMSDHMHKTNSYS